MNLKKSWKLSPLVLTLLLTTIITSGIALYVIQRQIGSELIISGLDIVFYEVDDVTLLVTINWGSMEVGVEKQYDFRVKNIGDYPTKVTGTINTASFNPENASTHFTGIYKLTGIGALAINETRDCYLTLTLIDDYPDSLAKTVSFNWNITGTQDGT